MKKLFFAIGIFALATGANAQEATTTTKVKTGGGTTFSIAGNVGTGTKTNAKTSYGGDVQAEFAAGNALKITASAGYQNFHFETKTPTTTVKTEQSFAPVLAGAKFNLGAGFYGHPQIGYSFLTKKVSNLQDDNGEFTYAASVGYGFGKNFDVSVKYLSVDVINAVLLRLAYNF